MIGHPSGLRTFGSETTAIRREAAVWYPAARTRETPTREENSLV